MAAIPHVYLDSGLTTQFNDSTPLTLQAVNGSAATGSVYVGTPTSGNQIQAASDPGTDQITMSIVDSSAGSGVEAAHIKLALSEAGLDSATGGAALNLGATISHGTPVRVWYRWTNSTGSGTSTEISLQLSARVESAA